MSAETLHTVSSSGSSLTVDLTTADVWDITLTANCTLSFTGATVGSECSVVLILRQDGTGGRTVTWPGGVSWPSGGAPTLNSTAASVTVVVVSSGDGGSTWLGFAPPSNGAAGADGGVKYTYSNDTNNTDPTSGHLKFDSTTLSSITSLRISETDADGNALAAWLATFDDSSSTVRGTAMLMANGSPTPLLIFQISGAITDNGAWDSFPITYIASPGSLVNGNSVRLFFARTGDTPTAVGQGFIKRTAGDLSITNDTNWHDVPTIGDVTIAAVASDVLQIAMNGVTDNAMRFEVQFPTSGNYAGPGITSTQGIAGWANRGTGAADVGGVIFYTVQSGDLSGGNIACRLRYTTNASGATKIFASTSVGPLTFGVVNLRH